MADREGTRQIAEIPPKLVYRSGRATPDTFTPRPGKDTEDHPGKTPGLSTFESLELAVRPGDQYRIIDLDLLRPPLKGVADDSERGGDACHISIVPVDDSGAIDRLLLEEWAATRGTGEIHPLTQNVLDAIVRRGIRPKQ